MIIWIFPESLRSPSPSPFSLLKVPSYMKNTTRNTKTGTLTVTLLNKIERIRRTVTAMTVVPKEAWVPFGFNCWQSSLPSSEEIFITGNSLCSALWKSKWLVTLITSYTNLATLKPDTHSSVQTRFFTYTPDIPICHCVYEVHGLWMSFLNEFFFEFADQPIMKTLGVILVWAYREQCVISKFNPR